MADQVWYGLATLVLSLGLIVFGALTYWLGTDEE